MDRRNGNGHPPPETTPPRQPCQANEEVKAEALFEKILRYAKIADVPITGFAVWCMGEPQMVTAIAGTFPILIWGVILIVLTWMICRTIERCRRETIISEPIERGKS